MRRAVRSASKGDVKMISAERHTSSYSNNVLPMLLWKAAWGLRPFVGPGWLVIDSYYERCEKRPVEQNISTGISVCSCILPRRVDFLVTPDA